MGSRSAAWQQAQVYVSIRSQLLVSVRGVNVHLVREGVLEHLNRKIYPSHAPASYGPKPGG